MTPLQIVMKSGLAGFSFGSELFLIIGLSEDAPRLSIVMLLFRLTHILVAGMFISIVFGDERIGSWLEKKGIVNNATGLHHLLCDKFSRAHLPFVIIAIMLSMVDCPLLQFLPWKDTQFYRESKGFPSLPLMKWTLSADAVQATSSVIIQIYYISTSVGLNEPTTSLQAKALFGLNISFSLIGITSALVTLCLKTTLLTRMETAVEAMILNTTKTKKSLNQTKCRSQFWPRGNCCEKHPACRNLS